MSRYTPVRRRTKRGTDPISTRPQRPQRGSCALERPNRKPDSSARAFDDAFHAALAQLRGEVSAACAAHASWPYRAAAAVGNGFHFAAREPGAAHLLTIEAHQRPAYASELVDDFA